MTNYLWPTPKALEKSFQIFKGPQYNPTHVREIEFFFESKLGCHAILFSSGRSAISALFKVLKISRGQEIFAPKWSSQCVWDVLSKYGTPDSSISETTEVILNVHKWGYEYNLEKNYNKKLIIQDSVDSLFTNSSPLFKTSKFEVLSLPKIIGSYFGGIVLTNDKYFYEQLKSLQGQNVDMAYFQTRLRLSKFITFDQKYWSWEYLENDNFSIDEMGTANIFESLKNYDVNVNSILQRMNYLSQEKMPFFQMKNDGRLPIHALIKASHLKKDLPELLKLNFNFNLTNTISQFEQTYLLPLHFGASEEKFMSVLNIIRNNLAAHE